MMAQRKQSFRFRIPWLSQGQSESLSRRPKDKPKSPPHSDTSVPIQRPSKPSELSPPSPSKAQEPQTTQPSSSPPKTQPHLASYNEPETVPKPHYEETDTHHHASSSEQEKEKMALPEPKPQEEPEPKVTSPLRTISKSLEQTSSQPETMPTQPPDSEQQVSSIPSPSSPISKTEPTLQPHPSPPLTSDHTNEVLKPQTEDTSSPSLPTSQEKKEPETSSQPEKLSTTTQKDPLEAQSKSIHHEEKEQPLPEITDSQRKGKDTIPTTKDSHAKSFRADKKAPQATVERKIMFATSTPTGKDTTRIMSSTTEQGTMNMSSSSISPEKSSVSSSSGEKAPLQKGIKDDITKFVHKLTSSMHPTQPMDDKRFSVITLVGDNRGATMHLGSESAKKEGSIHIHRAYKRDPEESPEVTTDVEEEEEENTKEEEEDDEDVGMAYVNSNIQSINNSLMFHGSITERDPGVQLTLPQKPTDPIRPNDKPNMETQRAQFNINRAEKLTFQPTVRRRFIVPSASSYPHGCKLSCDEDIEDIEIL